MCALSLLGGGRNPIAYDRTLRAQGKVLVERMRNTRPEDTHKRLEIYGQMRANSAALAANSKAYGEAVLAMFHSITMQGQDPAKLHHLIY